MKKGCFILAVSIFLYIDICYANDTASKFGIGVSWYYFLQNDADLEGIDIKNEETAENFNIGISYGLFAKDILNLTLLLDYEYIKRDSTHDMFKENLSTITMQPVMLNFQLRFLIWENVAPYFGFGTGYSFNSIKKGNCLAK